LSLTAWPIDENKTDAETLRQLYSSIVGNAGGLVAAGGLELKQKGTPNMSVQVLGGTPSEGGCWVPSYAASTGPTYFQNSATYEQLIETANASNPRIDTIVARIFDTSLDSSGKHEPAIAAIAGTPTSGATLGNLAGIAALPKAALLLGYVLVPAAATSIVTADIKNIATRFTPRISWGLISEAGAVEAGSGDYTVAKTGTGGYEIKWNPERASAAYAVLLTPQTTTARGSISGVSRTAKVVDIFMNQHETNAAENAPFAFYVYGG
jgi:hypothetical protein